MKKMILRLWSLAAVLLVTASCLSHKQPARCYMLTDALPKRAPGIVVKEKRPVVHVMMPVHLQHQRAMLLFNRETGEQTALRGGQWSCTMEEMLSSALAEALAENARARYASLRVFIRDFSADTQGKFVLNGFFDGMDERGKAMGRTRFAFSEKIDPKSDNKAAAYAACCNKLVGKLIAEVLK